MIDELISLFSQHKDPQFAQWQKNYMRNQFPFLGLRQPRRKQLQKLFLKKADPSNVKLLWNFPEREYQYTAIDLLLFHPREKNDLSLLEHLITTKSWWDTVDILASNLCGKFFTQYPDLIPHTHSWLTSSNLWLRRSSLLFQLRYKTKTDVDLLFSYCQAAASDPDPFIQRAIAWALREYAKTNLSQVTALLTSHPFSPLVFRETNNYISKNR